jgi:hypothetical protein
MNIFVLHTNPVAAAEMQCDKHVVKMCLETAQILSTVAGGPYKPTHQNHPCVIWARHNQVNYNWLARHGLALCAEYTARYGKTHKCEAVISSLKDHFRYLPIGYSNFVQCMPDEFKQADPVEAYRAYYHSKARFATWKRNQPFWWNPK